MFGKARWRLTLWFAGAVALILAVIGGAVYFSARTALFDQVNDDLRARSAVEVRRLTLPLLERVRRGQPDVVIGPTFTAGGYFYAVVDSDGAILADTPNVDPGGLPEPSALTQALADGSAFVDTRSSDGDDLRVLVLPLAVLRGQDLFLEVGRSTEPERQALERLLFILGIGGGVALVLAVAGGFFVAGRALEPIQTAMGRQRAFVADASHELRTPLALIRASAEFVKRHPAQPVETNMAFLDDIIGETDRLNGIVGQMLTLARADDGRASLSLEDVDLNELAADAVRQMSLLAESKEIEIGLQVDGPLKVRGDQDRLRELVVILLDNAIKYSDPGTSVRVQLRPLSGRAQIQVSDKGRGIPAEALPHIFDRFYRVDKARSREMGGAGLGLSIAKWIVDSHKGTIQVESEPQEGTRVAVEFPALPCR
ncbi:MAG: HAMP domain-containing sensor histidine kinase [Dehalococcoidia bacterium]